MISDPAVSADPAVLVTAPPAPLTTVPPAPLATFRDLCLDANDPALVGAFWAAVLGRVVEDAGQGDGSTHDVLLRPAADGGPGIYVNGVPEPKTVKDRLHLDLTLEPGQEVTDLFRLGATVVNEPDVERWWVLADPEGNEFCAFLPEADATNDADAEIPAGEEPRV